MARPGVRRSHSTRVPHAPRSAKSLLGLAGLALLGALAFEAPGASAVDAPVMPEAAASPNATFTSYGVATDRQLASEAAAAILASGGNAADAAATAMLVLGVVNPASSGFGGGGFALYYQADSGETTFLDFRERAPGAALPNMYDDVPPPAPGPINAASQLYGLSTGVPGEPAGIAALVERFGSKTLREVVAPAVQHARDGVIVDTKLARMSAAFADQMRSDPVFRRWFGPAGALEAGSRLRQPELARSLERFGREGASAVYGGAIGRAIVRANRARGGVMTLHDLQDYRVVEREPLVQESFGHRWVTTPPPSAGGFTLLQSLAMLERLPAHWRDPSRPDVYLHALLESWKGPFLDRQRYFGDPDHVELPLAAMMDDARITSRARAFHPLLAHYAEEYDRPVEPDGPPVEQPDNAGTSHFCVIDRAGNVASVTTTVNLPFGARYTAAGIVMNDEMDDFARGVGVANAFGLVGGARNLPGPGRRPVSTMSPTIIFDAEGRPVMCLGASGGSRIVTATEQVALNVLLRGMSLADANAAPRVHHQAHPRHYRTERIAPMPEPIRRALERRGHVHRPIDNVANVQALHIVRGEDGAAQIYASSDPRKGGVPAGE